MKLEDEIIVIESPKGSTHNSCVNFSTPNLLIRKSAKSRFSQDTRI